jgi:hypothetical protein
MHVPAWPVLPDSTLAPDAVLQKFRVRSLAGLGCGCSETDDTGTCLDPDPCEGPAPLTAGCPGSPGCPGYVDPNLNLDIQNTLAQLPTTTVGTQKGYVMPSQNSAAWANAIAQFAKAGMSLAQLNMIQPGTVLSANGAILRQAPGLPVPVVSGNLGVNANTGGSMLILAGVGLIAVMMLSRRN